MSGQRTLKEGKNGILQVISNTEKHHYVVADVMEILGVSKPKAYKVISALREELILSGKLLKEYPKGKIPKKYFELRCGGME